VPYSAVYTPVRYACGLQLAADAHELLAFLPEPAKNEIQRNTVDRRHCRYRRELAIGVEWNFIALVAIVAAVAEAKAPNLTYFRGSRGLGDGGE